MEKILKVHRVNDYARYIGAPELHPLVSVIHYDELEHCRHSLNNYDVYGMFIGDEELDDLSYGQLQYVLQRHALMCVAPGQIGGKTDTGEEIHTKGWALLFDTELLRNTELGRRMADYHFFSYTTSEALLLTPEQRQNSRIPIFNLNISELPLNKKETGNTLETRGLTYSYTFYTNPKNTLAGCKVTKESANAQTFTQNYLCEFITVWA